MMSPPPPLAMLSPHGSAGLPRGMMLSPHGPGQPMMGSPHYYPGLQQPLLSPPYRHSLSPGMYALDLPGVYGVVSSCLNFPTEMIVSMFKYRRELSFQYRPMPH